MAVGSDVRLTPAPDAVAGLRVVVDPEVKSGFSFDGGKDSNQFDAIPSEEADHQAQVVRVLEEFLTSAGYVVARNDGRPPDLTLSLSYHRDTRFDRTSGSLEIVGRSISGFVIVKRGEQILERIESPQQLDEKSFYADIVNKLSRSPRVEAIAKQVNPNAAATAAAKRAAEPAQKTTTNVTSSTSETTTTTTVTPPSSAAAQTAQAAHAGPAAAVAPTSAPTPPSAQASASSYVVAAPQPSAYALIIGIEKYRDVPSPTGARTDAEKFAKLARTTLGVPEPHIRLAVDDRATKGDIEKHLEWLKANAQSGSRIYFFFSGHGAPEPTTGTSYVLPYDGDPRYLEGTALRLTTVLARLQETKAREVLAVLDSCFSGAGGRSVLPPGARALVRVQAPPTAARIAIFSASSGAQTSGPAPNAPTEGLFTQKILEALGNGQGDMNGDGQVSLEELRDWVKPRVTRAAKVDNRDQTPELQIGNGVGAPSNFIVAWGLATK